MKELLAKDQFHLKTCLDQCDKGRLIDLACGHGGHSIIARDLGFDVTGQDGRLERIPFKKFDEKGIKFIHGLIEDVDLTDYDIILASGILYHLTLESNINLFKKVKESKANTFIVNTHFAIFENGLPINSKFRRLLSEMKVSDDLFYYAEYNERINYKEREAAALTNQYSCWFTLNSLIEAIQKYTGFTDMIMVRPFITEDRCWLIFKR